MKSVVSWGNERDANAWWETLEDLVSVLPLVAERREDDPRALDQLDELRPLATKHDADGVLAIALLVGEPVNAYRVRLAAAASAT